MRVLVIAAHPDDEVIGCGGTIAKHTKAGEQVSLCIMTKGYTPDWSREYLKNREKEIQKVKAVLGIGKIFRLGYPTAKLDTVPQKELNDSILRIVNEVKPDIVYIPHKGDLNKDHRLVFEASLVATRPVNSSVKRILSYETLSVTEWGQAIEPFVPNVYIDISETIGIKLKASKVYEGEIKKYPHPRSLEIIEALAKKRGSEACVKLAEAFVLIRELS
jgi:LmbE family N-acetylglucosaminyl deacetylase